MRVLVTGATGFVASHLLPALVESGHDVVALGHDRARIPSVDAVEALEVDLARRLPEELPSVAAIVHLAQANVQFPEGADALFRVNAASTAGLLEHLRRCGGGSFVFASSASVYGFGNRPFTEDDQPRAVDFYSATKLASERLVTAYTGEFTTTVMRLVAPYGPGQRGRLIPSLVERVIGGQPVRLNEGGRPRMNPVYVEDVVRTILHALESRESRLLNVSGDDVVGIDDLARLIGEVVGAEPLFEQGTGGAPGDLVALNDRLKEAFGFDDLVTLRDGLQRVAEVPA